MTAPVLDQLAALQARYPWQSAVVDGHSWRWIDTGGSGPQVALLPGAIGDSSIFFKTLMALGERLRLLAISYPDLSQPERLADGLAQLAQEQGWGPMVVVGSSYGAFWAQHFAKRHPQRVEALLLGNTFATSKELFPDPAAAVRQMQAATGAQVHQQWLERVQSAPASELRTLQEFMLAQRQAPDGLRQRMLGVAGGQPAAPFDTGALPITVLECDDDPVIPEPARAALRQAYPQARHVRFATGGHYPHVVNSGAYAELLLSIAT